jgi:TrpR-related protein YerC/YecD
MNVDRRLAGSCKLAYDSFHCINALVHYEAPIARSGNARRVRQAQPLRGVALAEKRRTRWARFLNDLCTPAELEVLVDRWRVVPYLLEGVSYREIHERTAVSITTIGRVARYLNQGNGGYLAAAARAARAIALCEKARA